MKTAGERELIEKEDVMEGLYFLVLWIGCALMHTLYDLKIKPQQGSVAQKNSAKKTFGRRYMSEIKRKQ